MKDVGGWRQLKTEDQELLAKQIKNSKAQIEQENEELHADELVQTKFQGQLREAPPGLFATLLPFQREGVSWMYDQEVNTEMVKGGILAGKYHEI
jgi:SNF2 family DNA or RNA helicase